MLRRCYGSLGPTTLALRLDRQPSGVSAKAIRLGLEYRPIHLKKLSASELGYLACAIDSEGWIGITRIHGATQFDFTLRPKVSISNTSRSYLEYIKSLLKLTIFSQTKNKVKGQGRWKESWQLILYPSLLRLLIPKLIPYLRAKKEQAILLNQVFPHLKKGHPSVFALAPAYFKLKHLNQRGPVLPRTYSLPCPQDGTIISETDWPICPNCGDLEQWIEGG